jgi:tetratricopeptide (TPR) repeat protein
MSEQLAAAPDDALAHEVCRQFYRLGYVTEKLGNKDKALSAYEKAYRLDATYLPSLEGLGNLLVQANRLDEALNVYQAILIHHREDLTDLEVVEIYWQLGEIHSGLKQMDRAQNHYEKALALDPSHEPSLRALVALADAGGRFDKSTAYRQSLIRVLEGDAKLAVCIELGRLAREKLSDPHTAIDAYLAAHKLQSESLSVMDSLYVLYRETKQGQKAAEMLEKMLGQSEVRQDPERAKRVYFALGEISRDELGDPQRAVTAFNAALDLDHRFLEAFSAAESLLGGQKQWKQLEENYVRMIQRLPKTDETHAPRMALWRALGELYLQVLKNSESALMAYQVAAAGLPDDAAVQETYAELLAQKPGEEAKAIAAYRKALLRTSHPAKVVSALAELAARRKDYDSAYLAAQVVEGLLGKAGPGEREILTKLGPYARKKEMAQQPLTDRLWKTHLFHPKVRGPVGELMAIVYQQVGHLYAVALSQYQVNPKKHRIDVPSAQEYQLHHYRYVARLLGMEAVELYSPFLVATRERLRKRSGDPVPEPLGAIEICHTHPVCLKVGGKFFSERSQKEIYYLIGRTLALLRPELALAHWLSPARLEAILQAALSLSGESFRITADPRAIEAERSLLQRALTEPARVALARAAREYIRLLGNADLTDYLDGAELTATRAGLFVAGEIEPVKRVVVGEVGPAYRVDSEAKLRELMVFATSEDMQGLRAAVGTQVEVQLRK